jgi:SMP-30/Gluconolactonase/LRE-like region
MALAGLLAPASAPAQDGTVCGPHASMQFICGVPTPEDMVAIPGSTWIIGSGLADLKNPAPFSGNLSLIDAKGLTATAIALDPSHVARSPYTECASPPNAATFSAHGLDIRPTADGMSTLFVVGHGYREAIEVFEIDAKAKVPKITWIGCVPAVEGAFNNAVVGLPDGRIIVTDFLHGGTSFKDLYAGRVTGAVYTWTPGGAFLKLPGTDMSGPNGLVVTPDEKYMFVADSGSATVLRFELAATEKPPVKIDPGLRTDNIRWAPDGHMLLAGPIPDPACKAAGASCHEMQVVKILDPANLKFQTVMEFRANAAFNYLSSALISEGMLWLGSPNGNGVAYTKLPKLP